MSANDEPSGNISYTKSGVNIIAEKNMLVIISLVWNYIYMVIWPLGFSGHLWLRPLGLLIYSTVTKLGTFLLVMSLLHRVFKHQIIAAGIPSLFPSRSPDIIIRVTLGSLLRP